VRILLSLLGRDDGSAAFWRSSPARLGRCIGVPTGKVAGSQGRIGLIARVADSTILSVV